MLKWRAMSGREHNTRPGRTDLRAVERTHESQALLPFDYSRPERLLFRGFAAASPDNVASSWTCRAARSWARWWCSTSAMATVSSSSGCRRPGSPRAPRARPWPSPTPSARPPARITDPGIAEAFTVIHARTREVLRHLRAAKRAWGHFHEEQLAAERVRIFGSARANSYGDLRRTLEDELTFMIYKVKTDAPYCICPYCGGAPWTEVRADKCEGCGGVGWGDRSMWDSAPLDWKAAVDARGIHSPGPAEGDAELAAEDEDIMPPALPPGDVLHV